MLLWLWCGSAAIPPIQALAWELPYALGAAQDRKKKKKKIDVYLLTHIRDSSQKGSLPTTVQSCSTFTIFFFFHFLPPFEPESLTAVSQMNDYGQSPNNLQRY